MTARPAGFYRKGNRHLTQGRGTILNPRFDIARSDRSIVTLGRVQQDALDELKSRIASGEMRFEAFDCPICGGSDIQPLAEYSFEKLPQDTHSLLELIGKLDRLLNQP